MNALLYIPWFQAQPWYIPLPLIGRIPIQPFGILVAIGVLLGAKMAEVFAKRNGVSPSVIADAVAHIVITGFILGYFLNAAFYDPGRLDKLIHQPALFFHEYLGLSSFGGFCGAVLGLFIFVWRRKIPTLVVADPIAFAFPFGWMFGRSGCFSVHDHPGLVTHFPLAVANYHVGYPPYQPRHDLGLYEVFWAIATVILFLFLWRKPRRQGFYFALLPCLYAPVRFFLDYLRVGPDLGGDIRYYGLTPGQYGSVVLGLAGMFAFYWIYSHAEPKVPAAAKWPPPDEEAEAEAPSSKKSKGKGGPKKARRSGSKAGTAKAATAKAAAKSKNEDAAEA